jgi:hypothetical protein
MFFCIYIYIISILVCKFLTTHIVFIEYLQAGGEGSLRPEGIRLFSQPSNSSTSHSQFEPDN